MNRQYFASSTKRRIPGSFNRAGALLVSGLFLFATITAVLGALRPESTSAAASTTLTFQARLLNTSGSLVADGTYNVEFKIYDTVGSGASAQGVCSLDSSTDDCWWLETRTGANKVTVKNGYVYANLGSVTAFSSTIPWDQELWITMNIGGTGAPSWDGEMSPRFKVAAVPYAFAAAKLQVTDSAITNKLVFATPSASNKTITLPNETGTVCTTGSVCAGYQASGSYANMALSNLSSVAINTALLPGADNTIDLGSSGFSFRSGYLDTSLITGATSFDLLNTSATTVNFAGAATALNLGAATGTTTVGNALTATGLFRAGTGGTNGSATAAGDLYIQDAAEIDGNLVVGDANTDSATFSANILGAVTTGATGTTTGTGTNVTTLTLTTDAFAVNDVLYIDNAGQDYVTRVTADAGTGSYTVSPAVTFETTRTVTKYNAQNVGATASDYTTLTQRFFQGYFLGGVVTGAGSTTLSDQSLMSSGALYVKTGGENTRLTVTSAGNVGIGTAAPTGALTVQVPTFTNRDTDSQHLIVSNSGSDSEGIRIGFDGTNNKGYINVLHPGVAWGSLILQDGGGNVGIGTSGTPAQALSVGGTTGNFTVSSAGVVTGGTYNSQTISSAANFTGTVAVAGVSTLTGGIADAAGTRMDSAGGWFRTYNSTGWYNGTYAVGMYATGTGYVDTYNNASLRTTALMAAGTLVYSTGTTQTSSICRSAAFLGYYWIGNCSSLSKYKDEQQNLPYGLDTIRQLRPVQYKWNIDSREYDTGFIAEEVNAVAPIFNEYDNGKVSGVRYDHMVSLAINGIKQLDVQVQANDARLAVLESGEFAGNLHVSGNVDFEGSLVVRGDTVVQQLTVNGKIISAGAVPIASIGTALTSVLGASIISDGTDTAGTITINSGSQNSAPGEIADVQFTEAYAISPKIVISGNNAKSSKLGAYVTRTANGFKIVTDEPVEPNQTYSFDYIIMQTTN